MEKPNWFLRLIFGQNVWEWSDFAHRVTGYKYYLLAHPDPTTWPLDAHRATSFDHFVLPEAEYVSVPKARSVVTNAVPMEWPEHFAGVKVSKKDYSSVSYVGHAHGLFMQRGTDQMRSVTWGRAHTDYMQQFIGSIPLPEAGVYYTTGWPVPEWDRHCVIVAPDGAVYEMIQFDPDHPGGTKPPLPNQALGWGVWRDGKLKDGKAVTAYDLPHHPYVWTRWSKHAPHELAIVMPDVRGGDGALPVDGPGPIAGERLALSTDSDTYRVMKAKGGECAALVEAAAVYGMVVIDRNGYADLGMTDHSQVGTKPRDATIHIQPDSKWAETNIAEFELDVHDLLRVTNGDADIYTGEYRANY